MKRYQLTILSIFLITLLNGCNEKNNSFDKNYQMSYPQILDISYTPSTDSRCTGWFVDQGSWMGFTAPMIKDTIGGFCGPYSLDYREWLAKSAVALQMDSNLDLKETTYYPGLLFSRYLGHNGEEVEQSLIFADANTALLRIKTNDFKKSLVFTGDNWLEETKIIKNHNSIIATHKTGEITVLCFEPETELELINDNYKATKNCKETYITISTFRNKAEKGVGFQKAISYLNNPELVFTENNLRWNTYLRKILRNDLNDRYNRIAIKSLVTLISNWKINRGGLLHEGIVPSHAVGYFMGFWAWDTWKFVIPLAKVTPELAKNMVRSMFDYQLDDGMIIDCIYVDTMENNSRDSKPPLACWAVDAIYEATQDVAFLKEMYPQLLSYYKWWYQKRDHDKNGICEFGSTDGTIEAAAWESGMDNAIRFDNSKMVKNDSDAWSFNQESVDLNAYLAYEWQLLSKFSKIIGEDFNLPNIGNKVADYFFDKETGYFYDKKLSDGSFIKEPGSEGYIPFWTKIASKEQMDRAMVMFQDTTMFSTYIPFPTIAANNPKYLSNGYWRGPIWLDQTYFAIKGLRNYGYNELADKYTEQVFNRLDGLMNGKPIHENYDSHTGECLKAPHFSWSASHLLLLYSEYKK